MASENVLVLDSDNFASTIADGVTLVDFWATWCGPCRMLTPIVGKVADAVAGRAKVAKVDIDGAQDLAEKYSITAVPTIVIFKNGEEVDRIQGVQPQPAITEKLEAQL